jgi:AraC-like DNA-binding protein
VAAPHPARHLLRARDLVDARYRDPLDVKTLAHAAKLSPAHFNREFRREFGDRRTATCSIADSSARRPCCGRRIGRLRTSVSPLD